MYRLRGGLIAVLVTLAAAHAAPAQEPGSDASITFSGGSVAAGVGYSWGGGVLNFKDKQYPFAVDGLSVVDVGVSQIDGSGDVYDLVNVSDFPGTYVAAGAGAALAGGGFMAVLENEHGVVIHFYSRAQGLKLTAAGQAVVVRVKE